MRTLVVDGGYNMRDLGHLPTGDGRRTLPNVLIRSGNPDTLTDHGQRQLRAYGLQTVIDLRDAWEVESYPTPYSQSEAVQYLHRPFLGDDPDWNADAAYDTLAALYIRYLEYCRRSIRAMIDTIAESAPVTLLHCYAGKDRTGIVAALVLGVAGVLPEAIIEDYAQSAAQLTHLTDGWREHARAHGQDTAQLERDIASAPETMRTVLDYLQQAHGGIGPYLLACGVAPQTLEALRRRLVASTPDSV